MGFGSSARYMGDHMQKDFFRDSPCGVLYEILVIRDKERIIWNRCVDTGEW